MSFFVFKVDQASPEWWEVRRGLPTASEFDRIITPAKGDLSTSADGYMASLIDQTLFPSPNYFSEYGFTNTAIEDGKAREAESRRWLSLDMGEDIQEVGFCVNEDFTLGCSPDGLIRLKVEDEPAGEWRTFPYYRATAESGAELKNPKRATQSERAFAKEKKLPNSCKVQPHGQMIVCGLKTIHWLSYCPPIPSVRIEVSWDSFTDKVAAATKQFVVDYKATLDKMRPR